jgi:hypothetical protein
MFLCIYAPFVSCGKIYLEVKFGGFRRLYTIIINLTPPCFLWNFLGCEEVSFKLKIDIRQYKLALNQQKRDFLE